MSYTMIRLLPVLFAFFVMGFVDLVGVTTGYVKKDFLLSDTLSNVLPMLVFLWFAVCPLPVRVLMGNIGRKKTVLLSVGMTFVAMLLPVISYSYSVVLFSFACLGIGNAILQVSLNPLLVSVVEPDKVTSRLTLGQFVKAISSMVGPLIVGLSVSLTGHWQFVFPVYAGITLVSAVWLWLTPFSETVAEEEKRSFLSILSLLKDSFLLQCFLSIVLIVGFEIGLMTAVPKYLLDRFGIPLEQGGLGCSIYFFARMVGTFVGSFLLVKVSASLFIRWNLFVALLSFGLFVCLQDVTAIWITLFMLGLSCSNVFPIMFSAALQKSPEHTDDLSAIMIMGVAGGAVLPLIMGVVADISNLFVSLFVPFAALAYIFCMVIFKLK